MYRRELDGLRALAVTAVLLNHANKDWLPGGFLGVDSFFVISGYVVACSYEKRITQDARAFYKRRLKRLQPALMLMVSTTALLAVLAGLFSIQHYLTALTSLIGLSNITLLTQSLDYFGTAASKNPFTHTWSLGVEEQFYLIFPLLISRPKLLRTLIPASLTFWLILSTHHPHAAFFLMPTRLWELGIGVLLWKNRHYTLQGAWIANAGFMALISSFLAPLYLQTYSTLLAVAATSCLIIGLQEEGFLKNLLSLKPLVDLGQHAYGLYLWHWPLLVLAQELWPDTTLKSVVMPFIITGVLAWSSYRFVEYPLRHKSWGFQHGLIAIGINIVSLTFLSIYANHGVKSKNYQFFSDSHKSFFLNNKCHSSKHKDALKYCLNSDPTIKKPKIILTGDSHAAHLRPLLETKEAELIQLSGRNIPNLYIGNGCREKNYCFTLSEYEQRLNSILDNGSIVVFGISPKRIKSKDEASSLRSNLENMANIIVEADSQLLLVSGLPQINCNGNQSFSGLFNRGGAKSIIEECSSSLNIVKSQNNSLDAVLKFISKKYPSNTTILDTLPSFCNEDICLTGDKNGDLYVWDDLSHLTPKGREVLKAEMKRTLESIYNKRIMEN